MSLKQAKYLVYNFIFETSFIADMTHFQKLFEKSTSEFDFQWNAVPEAIGKINDQFIYKSFVAERY